MTPNQPRVEFRAWTGGYVRPSCIKLSLYLGGPDDRTSCAAIAFWREVHFALPPFQRR